MEELNKLYIYEKLKHLSEKDVKNYNISKKLIHQNIEKNSYSLMFLSKIALILKCDFKSLFLMDNKIIEE